MSLPAGFGNQTLCYITSKTKAKLSFKVNQEFQSLNVVVWVEYDII